jgi:hypothetical protein
MTAPAVSPDGIWLTIAETAAELRLSDTTVWRIADRLPGFRAGTARRILAAFVADAKAAISAGESIDLVEYARQWKSRGVPGTEVSPS